MAEDKENARTLLHIQSKMVKERLRRREMSTLRSGGCQIDQFCLTTPAVNSSGWLWTYLFRAADQLFKKKFLETIGAASSLLSDAAPTTSSSSKTTTTAATGNASGKEF
uniref:Uncharacterized protein n=1 Tax=Globodera rostochiensis TaxID=31243 RepID=A0A914I058_GLORO